VTTDAAAVVAVVLFWLSTLVLAYGRGWLAGFYTSENNHRWSRWLLRNNYNRSTRL